MINIGVGIISDVIGIKVYIIAVAIGPVAIITNVLGHKIGVVYGAAPAHLVWWLLFGSFVAAIAAVLAMREPGQARPGVLASLRRR
jgi:hypothetical protein